MNKLHTENINKKNELFTVLLSISFSFTVFFFAPAELYIRNQKDFLINSSHILLPLLILSFIISAVFIILFNFMLLDNMNWFIVFSRIITGLLIAFYIQEMFLNGKMNAITGDSYAVNLTKWESVLNGIFIFIIVILPLILYYCSKSFPNVRIFQIGKGYAIPYLAGLIFLMQFFGFVGSIAQFGLDRYERLYNIRLSYEPSMSLSEENNIIVFIPDRLDSFYMDELLETYPDMYEELSGFTFYQNNVSHYTNTFPSLTNMLTGLPYECEDWDIYFKNAWEQESFIDELRNNNFQINLLLDHTSTYNSYYDLENKCDNLVSYDAEYTYNYFDENGIIMTMTSLSLGKLLPYSVKWFFIKDITPSFSLNFIHTNQEIPGMMPESVDASSDLKYYDYLVNTGLTNDNIQKTFTFIHLQGAHAPYSMELSGLYSDEIDDSSLGMLSTIRGDFEIIFEYIRQMKSLGLYDNSTIIIVGDHGRIPSEIESQNLDFLTSPIVTTLLIKPPNAENIPLQLNSDAELSNDYFAASILEYAEIDHSSYGYSYNDIINSNLHVERYFQTMYFFANGNITPKAFYRITGNARDFENWKMVDY